jgi:hypothetical protein
MSFSWSAYLSVAEVLVRERGALAPEEACCRAAISRAYYAAYGMARNHARDHEQLSLQRTGGDHQRVLLHYRRRPDRFHQGVAELLFRLRRQRNQADYNDQMPTAVASAHVALRRARQVLAALEALPTRDPNG